MQTDLAPSTRARSRYDDTWVYFDGEVVRYQDVRLGPDDARAALRHGLLRRHSRLLERRAGAAVSAQGRRALRSPAPLGEHPAPAAPHSTRRAGAHSRSTCCASNESRTDTYIRPLVFISAEEIGVRLHGLQQSFLIYTAPLGEYIALDGGIRCVDQQLATDLRRRDPGAGQDHRLVRQLGAGQVRGARGRLRRGDHAVHGRPCQRGLGREPVHVQDGVFVTPPVTDDILEGITRDLLIGPDSHPSWA